MRATVIFQRNWDAVHATREGIEPSPDRPKLLPGLSLDPSRRYRYIINSGSSRSSKTFSIIQLFYLYAMEHPGKKLAVFRDTKQICKSTVLEDMKRIYPSLPGYETVTLNITESVYKFANGSAIHIEGTDDSVKIHGYHCDVLWFNEGYEISKDTFDQLDMRCTDFVLLDLNPRQSHWSEDVAKRENALLIHSTWKDNPFCPREQKLKILSYQPIIRCSIVRDTEEKAKAEGLLTETQARGYDLEGNPNGYTERQVAELRRCRENEGDNSADSFKWDVYSLGVKGERPNRIFHFTEIADEAYKQIDAPIYYGVDWGSVDPWGILEAKYYDGGLYLHERNYASENILRGQLTTTEQAQVNGQDEGIVTWLFRKLAISTRWDVVCDPNRTLKITALRNAGYQAHIASKPAGSIIDGIDLLNNMPVYYTKSSTNLAYEQENYSRKVDRYGVVLEEAEDVDNHLMDPARYIAAYLQRLGIIRRV